MKRKILTLMKSEKMVLADGFEGAFLGSAYCWQSQCRVAVYSRADCIKILMQDGGSHDEAEEFFEYNVVGTYIGERTPLFVDLHGVDELVED